MSPRWRAGSSQEFRQVRDDDIGAVREQVVAPAGTVDADHESESAGAARSYSGDRVLDDDTVSRLDVELLRSTQEAVWRRFACKSELGDGTTVHPHVEQLGQACHLEHCFAIAARRHDGGLEAGGSHASRELRAAS